jgi:hypothetical protein
MLKESATFGCGVAPTELNQQYRIYDNITTRKVLL